MLIALALGVGLGFWLSLATSPEHAATLAPYSTKGTRGPAMPRYFHGQSRTDSAGAQVSSRTPANALTAPAVGPVARMSARDVSVAELEKISFNELQIYCRGTDRDFVGATIDAHLPFQYSSSDEERQGNEDWIFARQAELSEKSAHWSAHFEIPGAKSNIAFDVLLKLPDPPTTENPVVDKCLYLNLRASAGEEPAQEIFTAAGCSTFSYRRRGNDYFMQVDTYTIPLLSDQLDFLLVPMPFGPEVALEYLENEATEWRTHSSLKWEPLSKEQYDESVYGPPTE